MIRRLGFTGTQKGLTVSQKDSLTNVLDSFLKLGYTWMHNGDCIGADEQAANIWLELGGALHLHPPTNDSKRAFLSFFDDGSPPQPYRERNQAIVDAADRLVACPAGMTEELRSGTWMTIRMARKRGIVITIVWPDGSTTWEI